jgi:HEPN domain-containing protein
MIEPAKIKTVAKQWIDSSDKDFKTMNHLFTTKDYAWSLFVGHLVIEKLLKGYLILKTGKNPPFIHNLVKISEKAGMEMEESQKISLAVITTFNLNARYDNEKKEFYRRCTRTYTIEKLKEIKRLRKWIKEKHLS